MNLKDFSLLGEDDQAYQVGHPKGNSMRVEKAGLSEKAHQAIKALKPKNMADGGEADSASDDSDPDRSPAAVSDFILAKGSVPDDGTPIPQSNGVVNFVQKDLASLSPEYGPPAPPSDAARVPADSVQTSQAAPVPGDGAAKSQPSSYPDMSAGLQNEKNKINEAGNAEALSDQAQSKAYQDYLTSLQNQPTPQDIFNKYQDQDQKLAQAFLTKKIDPNRYLNNTGPDGTGIGSKLAAGIGLVLSGIGSARTGQPNMAYEMIKGHIDRDIEAQKNDQSNALNLWKMNREAYGNEQAATLATQNQMLNIAKAKTLQAVAQAQGPMAQARAAQLTAPIDQEIFLNNYKKALLSPAGQTGYFNSDPAQLVPLLVKDPAQQKQVFDEIGRAQNVSNNSQRINEVFDQAANDNTILQTGGGMLRTPGSVMALHQLLLPNFKQVDGTVRQAAMDETFHNVTPAPGDTAAKIAQKKQALQDWMHSETAAPMAKGYGLDLNRFSSTTPDPRARFTPVQKNIYQQAKARLSVDPNDPYGQAALKKLGVQ